MKTVVLGIGNPILCDDGVGIHVSRQLRKQINDPDVTIDEAYTGGMNLLDLMLGYDKAILIDTINIPHGRTGDVKKFSLCDASSSHSYNPHDVSLQEALSLAQKLGEHRIPCDIVIIGIVVKHMSLRFGEHLSKQIAGAVPKAVNMTLGELKNNKNVQK